MRIKCPAMDPANTLPAAEGAAAVPHRRSLPMYVAAGALATAGHYMVTIALVEWAGVRALAASVAGFVVGATIKYVLGYFVAFASDAPHARTMARFALALAVLVPLNAACFALLHHGLGMHYVAAQLVTTALLVPPGYLASRLWVFVRW
jgi:putative flippase GtrA